MNRRCDGNDCREEITKEGPYVMIVSPDPENAEGRIPITSLFCVGCALVELAQAAAAAMKAGEGEP